MNADQYRFRLTFFRSSPRAFRFEEESIEVNIGDGLSMTLAARDADRLIDATKFHFEYRGFESEETAREAGERLRLRLRVLNAILGLGFTIPVTDTRSSTISQAMKDDVFEESGAILLEPVSGLAIMPDDDRYVEQIVSGRMHAFPSDPNYIFKALTHIWDLDLSLDQRAEDALDILNRALKEGSPRTQFLLVYLALERMVDRKPRSEEAQQVLEHLKDVVENSDIEEKEKQSLYGALSMLHNQSFSSALKYLANSITDEVEINGRSLEELFRLAVKTRNTIVHNANLDPSIKLSPLTNDLRHFVLTLIWTLNGIPDVSIDIPRSTVQIPAGGLTIRVR